MALIRSDYVPTPIDMAFTPGESYCVSAVPAGIKPFEGAALGSPRRFVVHLARALAAVHRAGIAHRDLCAQTIALTPVERPVLFDSSYMKRMQSDGTVKSIAWARQPRPSDAPETARAALAGGVAADMYSFAFLARAVLGPVDHPLLEQSLDPLPARRPPSMDLIADELERAWRQGN